MIRFLIASLSILILTSGMAQAQDQTVVTQECQLLPEHKPTPDVAYTPDVDVHGKPVVPADINGVPVMLNDQPVVVPLTIDLAQRLQGVNVQGLELKGTQGFLEIYPNGRVTYNGQDLTSQVYVLCGKTAPNQ